MRKKISDEEADKLLEEQYIREAKEMEAYKNVHKK